jgi:hypothetical protein
MSHPDTSWRVAVIYRCCVRYGKQQTWATEQLAKLQSRSAEGKITSNQNITNIGDIWFRENGAGINHIDMQRRKTDELRS